jgi:hypothetical protein
MMPREQHLHGKPVSARDPLDQHFVRCLLHQDGRLMVWSRAQRFRFKWM